VTLIEQTPQVAFWTLATVSPRRMRNTQPDWLFTVSTAISSPAGTWVCFSSFVRFLLPLETHVSCRRKYLLGQAPWYKQAVLTICSCCRPNPHLNSSTWLWALVMMRHSHHFYVPPATPPQSPHLHTNVPRSVSAINSRKHLLAGVNAPRPHIMDAVKIPSETVPEGMKVCEQILKRAKELKKAEPVVAYWCTFTC